MWPFKRSKKEKKKLVKSVDSLLFISRWEKITRCRDDQNLQGLHSLEDAKRKHLQSCSPCPICGDSVNQLSWLYYLDPEHSWPRQGGWMTVCDKDKQEVNFFITRQEFYPWEIIDAARNDKRLQAKFRSRSEVPQGYECCPNCKRLPKDLSWFWFSSPEEEWQALAGGAGWMSVCDVCHIQVEFLEMIMS